MAQGSLGTGDNRASATPDIATMTSFNHGPPRRLSLCVRPPGAPPKHNAASPTSATPSHRKPVNCERTGSAASTAEVS